MALKYFGEFDSVSYKNVPQKSYRLEIFDDVFVGDATEICFGGSPLVEKETSGADKGVGVRGCRLECTVVADDISIQDIYAASAKSNKFTLEDLDTNEIIRQGYLLAEDTKEVYEDGTKTLELSFTDGLETLSGDKFELVTDVKNAGKLRILEIIAFCLNKVALDLDIYTSFNWYNDDIAVIDVVPSLSTLYDHDVHTELFEGDTCYEVLEKICETLNLAVFQEDGAWWIHHAFVPSVSFQYYQKYDKDLVFITSGVLSNSRDVLFDEVLAPTKGDTSLQRQIEEYITKLKILDRFTNLLPNPSMVSGTSPWTEWRAAHPVDSFSAAGTGTVTDPNYIQIDGYQPKNLVDYRNIGGLAQINFLTIMEVGDNYAATLNKALRISGRVQGKGVEHAYALMLLQIETTSITLPYITAVIGQGGELIAMGVTNTGLMGMLTSKLNILKYGYKIDFLDSEDNPINEYIDFTIETGSLLESVFSTNGFWGLLDGGLISGSLGLVKITPEDFVSVKLSIVLTEGHDRTSPTSAPEWVRWAEMNVELLDRSRAVGLTEIQYHNKNVGAGIGEVVKTATFGDYYNPTSFVAIYNHGGSTTSLWRSRLMFDGIDLLQGLNRELLSLYESPLRVYDGDVMGRPKKYWRTTMLNYEFKLINVYWNYDFYDSRLSGSRYYMLFDEYSTGEQFKIGKYDGTPDGKEEVVFTELAPPQTQPDATGRKGRRAKRDMSTSALALGIYEIEADVVHTGGGLQIEKDENNEAIVMFYNNITGLPEHYIKTLADGVFEFGDVNTPYTMTIDLTTLTTDRVLNETVLSGGGGGGGGGVTSEDIILNSIANPIQFWDMYVEPATSLTNASPWIKILLAGMGANASTNKYNLDNHPGVYEIRSASTASGAIYGLYQAPAYLILVGSMFKICYKTGTTLTASVNYLGFSRSYNIVTTPATSGVYWHQSLGSADMVPEIYGALGLVSGTAYTLAASTWYTFTVEILSLTDVRFTIESDGVLMNQQTIVNDIPVGGIYIPGMAVGSNVSSTIMMYLDYLMYAPGASQDLLR
jgi:hypothetical protein